jgi:hypothetical protein
LEAKEEEADEVARDHPTNNTNSNRPIIITQ